jgi:hypothetical protein
MKNKKIVMLIIVGVLFSISLVIGTSYALWTINHTQTTANILDSGCFSTTFTDADNINLNNQYPISDTKGLTLKPYTFTIKNTCTITSAYNINLETLKDTTASSQYIKVSLNAGTPALLNSFSTTTSTITDALGSNTLHTDYLAAGDSATYTLRLWITEEATTNDMANKVFDSKIVIISSATDKMPLTSKLLSAAGGKTAIEAKTAPTFSNSATTDEGMFATPDDYGTSYYYRGAVKTNNVLFGGFCWKVIRINGNGTTRMIYNGTPSDGQCTNTTGTSTRIGTSAFNTNYNDNAYVGYMYGATGATTYEATHANTNSSTIKTAIDAWYNTNLASYASKISDTEFCNDRSIASTAATWTSSDTAKGYGTNETDYGAYNRRFNTHIPALTCQNKNDRFTVSDTTTGNGNLTNPVGLITMDEVGFAGASMSSFDTNNSYYLYTNRNYWTMSSCSFDGTTAIESVVGSAGNITNYNVDIADGLRPVINLKTDTLYTSGDGTSTSPYVIS